MFLVSGSTHTLSVHLLRRTMPRERGPHSQPHTHTHVSQDITAATIPPHPVASLAPARVAALPESRPPFWLSVGKGGRVATDNEVQVYNNTGRAEELSLPRRLMLTKMVQQ